METTVENVNVPVVQDDAALTPVQEEPISELSEIANEQPEEHAEVQQKEPGYVRKRIDAAVAKAVRETEQRMQAKFDEQLAPIRESMYARQADDLVNAGEFKSKEMALEYVRLKAGAPAVEKAEQPRDAQGRFTQQQVDPMVQARANLLFDQAKKIQTNRGVDVMAEYQNNPDVQQRVLSGEWDFYDVAEAMSAPQRRAPAPMRSTNGASGSAAFDIAHMTDAQFEQLNKNLAAGKTYR